MAEPRPVQPVWSAEGREPFDRPGARTNADVIVIGAGFVGLAAALDLLDRGRDVIVLDQREVGEGASGMSAGHVGPMLYGARKGPDDMIRLLGADMGSRLNRQVAAAGARLFETIEAHSIQCEARRGYVGVYRSEKSLRRAEARFELWRQYGGKVRGLAPDEVRDHIASDRYVGGFLIEEGGWLNPLKLLRGLARAASGNGASIQTGDAVVSANRVGDGWSVRTSSGAHFSAPHVLLATGPAPPPFAREGIRGSFYVLPCGIAATARNEVDRSSTLPAGGPVADFDDPAVFAPVFDDAQRLVVSFLMRDSQAEQAEAAEPAVRRLRKLFNRDVRFETFSAAAIPITMNGIPNLMRREDGLLAVTACNGFGLTLGMVAGRAASEYIAGTPPSDLALPLSEPKALGGRRIVPALFRNAIIPLANRFGA